MRLKTTLLSLFLIACFQQIYAQSCGADFETVNGLAVLELDSKTAGGWERRSDSGASGGQALYYNGSNSFNSPPGNSVITYSLQVNTPGTYRVIVRNKIGIVITGPPAPTTEHNDMWLKVNGNDFFGQLGSGRVWPVGSGRSPNPEGASGNGYFKLYTNTLGWNWTSFTDDSGGHNVYATFNAAGVYTIQVGGRSNGFLVDKIALYLENSVGAGTAQSAGSTACDGSTPPPPPPPPTQNVAPTVSITGPSNGQSFDAGSNITVDLSANDSDGSIASHQITLNGNLVDTDGGFYSPYQIGNAQPGSYTITATVTDNSGATASSTVNITVEESDDTTDNNDDDTPPPPPPPTPTENVAPTVSITSPSTGQNIAAGSSVSVNLASSDSDGSVVKHEIFVNGTLVDTDGASYTPHIIGNIGAGTYTVMATVTDNDGATASSSVSITVDEVDDTTDDDDDEDDATPPPTPSENAAPTISFTNLANGDQVTSGTTVPVGVSASDSDGSVVKYQVFVNGLLVDTDGANYTPHPITNIASGNYTIKVTVTDNNGATASATVNITAGSDTTPPPPPAGSEITFDLINASSNGVIGALVEGAAISSSKTQGVNIRINTPSEAARVGYEIYRDGALAKIGFENFAPYAVYGDIEGDYYATNLLNGSYTLVAAAYSGSGTIFASKTIKFTVGSASGKSAFIFPNPVQTDGKVSVRLPEGSSGKFEYSVTNSLGVQVERGTFDAISSQRDVELNLPNIGRQVQGVYYMTLSSNGSRETIPLIRE